LVPQWSLQVCGGLQLPQLIKPPHPSDAVPHWEPPGHVVLGTHASASAPPSDASAPLSVPASGVAQASLISADKKNVLALERQSLSPHSRPRWLRWQVSLTTTASCSRLPGHVTSMAPLLPVQVTLPSVELALSDKVKGDPTGTFEMVPSSSRGLRTSIDPVVEKPFGPAST
jgi:hypothetical protein